MSSNKLHPDSTHCVVFLALVLKEKIESSGVELAASRN